ncbi:flavin reductase family protein [Fodinicurvata sediminis]|uniref:flavin reductase family protein n=1 Tax=Fodinicurvata sediminis TaxID=1121832 RepID=UPI0003B49656|nr:flavin reductase family protein [Fodinicurvata sediminis]
MFYEAGQHKEAGFPHDPFKALVVPRPIGWISTLNDSGGVNLAPYSFFNAVASSPPIVFFAPNGKSRQSGVKDSQDNAERTGEFVVNLATWDLKEAMNQTSASLPSNEAEPEHAGLEMIPSKLVGPPRVKRSPVSMECRYLQTLELPSSSQDTDNFVVFGEVIGLHIADDLIDAKGMVDITQAKPVARLGYMDYAVIESVFSMQRP